MTTSIDAILVRWLTTGHNLASGLATSNSACYSTPSTISQKRCGMRRDVRQIGPQIHGLSCGNGGRVVRGRELDRVNAAEKRLHGL